MYQWLFCISLLFVCNTLFADVGRVTILQSPAWLQRDGNVQALRVGNLLLDGDEIKTGRGSRVVIALAEGSEVKIGENSSWILEHAPPPSRTSGVFEAVMAVANGAFRFTTSALTEPRPRNIKAKLTTATIGIRGTDVWGRSTDQGSFVVLIEGSVEVESNGSVIEMNEPLSLFNAPVSQDADPLTTITAEALARYAQETEPQIGRGVQREQGVWRINLASYRKSENAFELMNRLDKNGFPAQLVEANVNDQRFYRVFVGRLGSTQEANALGRQLKRFSGINQVWPEMN